MSRAFALATLVVAGLMLADLWAHQGDLSNILGFGAKESRYISGR